MIRPLGTGQALEPTMDVVPAPLIDARMMVFPHDWGNSMSVITRWDSDTTTGYYSGAETTVGSSLRPVREVSSNHVAGDSQTEFLRQWIARLSPREEQPNITGRYTTFGSGLKCQSLLMCDVAKVTLVAGQLLGGDFLAKRFFPGQRIAVFKANFEPFQIGADSVIAMAVEAETVTRDNINITAPPVAVEVGMLLVPVMDFDPGEEIQLSMTTNRVTGAQVTLIEARGPNQLPPLIAKGSIPFDFPRFQGSLDAADLLLFEVDQNWSFAPTEQTLRPAADGLYPIVSGQAPRRGVGVTAGIDRLEWYRIARAFDSMHGGTSVFWAIMPEVVSLTATKVDLNTIRITPQGNQAEWAESHQAVAFKKLDGTWTVHELGPASGDWEFVVIQDLPDDPITCLRWATYARFQGEMDETWSTAGEVTVDFTIVEAPAPIDIELADPV